MEESSRASGGMDTLQSYLERDPCLLTDLQLSSSSDCSDITSEEEEDFGSDGGQGQNIFAIRSQKLLDKLEMLEAEFQNKAALLAEEEAEGVQVSKENSNLEQLNQQSVTTLTHLPENKPLNYLSEHQQLHHLPEVHQTNYLLNDPPPNPVPEVQPLNHLLPDQSLSDILECRPLSNILEFRPLSDILEGGPINDLQEDRLPQPEHGSVSSESITNGKEEDHQPKDLEETVRKLLEEKKQNTEEIGQLKCQIQRLKEEVKGERLEKKSLAIKLQKGQRNFLKLNRVSLAVTQECAEIMGQLELEQDLRHEAEIIAHQMLREKRAVNRQSMIVMQNMEPDEMLMKALEDVHTLTTTLDKTRAELQTQVKSLELQLAERPSQEEFIVIKEDLNAANMEKYQLEEQLKVEQEKCVDLQEKVKALEEKLKEKESSAKAQENVEPIPSLPPPPPPPLPPPCLISKDPKDPLALLREQRGLRAPTAKNVTVSPDVKDKAIQEMKKRIEEGVFLRPTPNAGQRESATNKRKSVISELQGILLKTAKKPLRRASRHRFSRKAKDNELSCALQKRRQIVDLPSDKTHETPRQAWERPTETKTQIKEQGGLQVPEKASTSQNSLVFIKMGQGASPEKAKRGSQVQWQ